MKKSRYFWISLFIWMGVICPAARPYTLEHFHFTQKTYYATISENAVGKTYLNPSSKMGIHSPDPHMQITYQIVAGNRGNIFKAEEYSVGDFWFLLVRTHTFSRLNRELQKTYRLTIEGKGRNGDTIKTRTILVINVLDVNDLQPLFDPVLYSVNVSEAVPLHHSVAQIFATDGDEGINAEIYYSFENWSDMFAIHPTTGQVTVTRHLNQSKKNHYSLNILADDRGPKTQQLNTKNRRVAELIVNVKEANYKAPNITIQSLPSVVEHGRDPTVYAILKVHDEDNGHSGLIRSVRIVEGQYSELFYIRETSSVEEYNVVVKEGLDRESMPGGLNLTIEASDRGDPSKTSQQVIEVKIIDTNDNKPKFGQESYEAEIEEIAPPNTPILFVKADDMDLGKNAEIVHEISSGNSLAWFKINKKTGLISTANYLDREIQGKIILEITAEDRANRGSRKSGSVEVIITILDSNDNAPVFNISSTDITFVYENQPIGSLVYTVRASDADIGENGYFSYAIANINKIPFDIHPFSGAITTTQILDYESMRRSYKVKVRASDWGSPFRQESEVILTINIKDVNDNKPEFEKTNCAGFVSREVAIGTELIVVPALDYDHDIIRYQIQSGNDDDCFNLASSTGILTLACNLSDYRYDKRQLVLVASDGQFNSRPVTVDITLVSSNRNMKPSDNDVRIKCEVTQAIHNLTELMKLVQGSNDGSVVDYMSELPQQYTLNANTPAFNISLPEQIEVSEGVAIDSVVLSMEASDPDPGFNGMLVYSILSGDPLGQFKMGMTSGDLLIMSSLDRESIPEYNIIVSVSDLGSLRLSATATLKVVILDENDNPPKFEQKHYEAVVSESISVNATVTQVFAVDDDIGINGKVGYSLLSDIREFSVNPNNGIITVKRPLDREKLDTFHLVIAATDHGKNVLTSSTTVTIKVLDVNDNAPRFVPDSYNIKIREDLPLGAVITTITAEDPDDGPNGDILYSLEYGMDGKFKIDMLTGTVRLVEKLKFELKQVYNISAYAKDVGLPSLTSICFINIEIIDVNENFEAPQFESFVLQGYVMENAPIGTVIMTLNASDPDGSGGVTYSIRDGSGLGRFTIDNNGTLFSSQVFDRETASHYWLTVYCQDQGVVPLYSHVEVYIEIMDENDNVPMTLEPIYYVSVPEEDDGGGQFVVQVEAEDLDQNPAQRLTFELTGGDPQNFFTINPNTGKVTTTKRKLDRETIPEHWLEVTVKDNGDPNLSSTARIIVKVDDINDNKPQFLERLFTVRIMATSRKDTDIPVYRALAVDRDEGRNADITYSLKGDKSSSQFRINSKTGMVYSTKDLDNESVFILTLKATDNGKPQRRKSTARMNVRVIPRPQYTVNAPFIKNRQMRVTVMENDPVGTLVAVVEANDPDGDKLWYSIIAGNSWNHFTVIPEDGSLLVAGQLDWEKFKTYNLTVGVSDGVKTTFALIEIVVIDINDNTPTFTQARYDGDVSENAEVGTSVLKVSATDQDNNSKLFYTIPMAVNVVSMRKLGINSKTGVISVAEELDREALSRHEFTVMVRDQGIPSKRNLTRVVINVLDHNDHAPEFLSSVFEGRVFETAAVGTSVLQTMAIDRDKGVNAETEYSLIAGNIGGAFNIETTLGTITTAIELDRDLQEEYYLTVMAKDRGEPPLTSMAQVNIFVTISNNAAPKFTLLEYTVDLVENKAVGTNVIAVVAKSQSSVVYKIIDGNEQDKFDMNPNSGVIFTNSIFDFEESVFYNLTISATNIVGASSLACVLVHIVDENDNAPKFLKAKYFGNISESALPDMIIMSTEGTALVVKAEDDDSGLNSQLTYEIVDNSILKYFSIDPNTGAIWTVSPVDREQFSEVEFRVQVHDNGRPRLQAQEAAIVHIYIEDVNDCAPEFSKSTYNTTVVLPTYKDVAVIELVATDPDVVSTDSLAYIIYSGNEEGKFEINSKDGTIYVQDESDMADNYILDVYVNDGKFETSARVFINVTRSLHSGLTFSKESYEVSVLENKTEIMKLAVIQPVGDSFNKHLKYKLLNGLNLFVIGETSGVLRTKGIPLDCETQDEFHLLVQVTDLMHPVCVAHVLIHLVVEDVNDNRPIFVNQPYYSVVSLEASPGDSIKQVTAIDRDKDANGQVTYRIIEGDHEMFYIHAGTGQIFVKTHVSFDVNTELTLVVEAIDGGKQSMSAQTEVKVRVISKAHPLFEKQFYIASIPENVQIHTPVIGVRADSPSGEKLLYSIVDGDPNGEFAVDFNIGVITVLGLLDFETTKEYLLTLRAIEMNTGAYTETYIRINIEDVNDQAPDFDNFKYRAYVREGIPVGSFVTQVKATDNDSGMNGKVYFSLSPLQIRNNDFEKFSVDQESGQILTDDVLDREIQEHYSFLVVAIDSGVPALSSVVQVDVIVEDLNDNAPVFDQPSYDCTITDQATRGQLVTKVSASDPDPNDEGLLEYLITAGNDRQIFSIDGQTGLISLSNQRRPQLHSSYTLNVSVTDGVFTSFSRVSVTVRSYNHHSPVFTKQVYVVEFQEGLGEGTLVTKVQADDLDYGTYGMLTYSIPSQLMQQYFSIDADTGEIFSRQVLDREQHNMFEISVSSTDNGGRMAYSTVHVSIMDKNDNLPQFFAQEYKAAVKHDSPHDLPIFKVKASDADIGKNGKILYSIHEAVGSRASELFSIDPDSGIISVKADLQESVNEVYQFFVRAVDCGVPPLENNVPVEIFVMGPLDTPPFFQQETYAFFIPENAGIGKVIGFVSASSQDQILYKMIPGHTKTSNSDDTFRIDQAGNIHLDKKLDREENDQYLLTIQAQTLTTPSLVAHTEVHIQIMDVNDNHPKFESDPYIVTLSEDSEPGINVIQVRVYDEDKGSHFKFSFDESSQDLSSVFSLDTDSGWLQLMAPLDREKTDVYNVTVLVIDGERPDSLSNTTLVQIQVTDCNDNPPVFKRNQFTTAVNEGAPPGTILLSITTVDADIGINSNVNYFIIGGDLLGKFQVHKNGEIFVNGVLDRENVDHYKLLLAATDGGYVTTATILVEILDDNDNSPVCEKPFYQEIIPEDTPSSTFVIRVRATDSDEAGTRNSKIEYFLEGDGAEMFLMDKSSGVLTTNAPLDRERMMEYNLIANAVDGGGKSCTTQIFIILEDVNDNAPRFILTSDTITITEDADIHTLLARVSASDPDLGINRIVKFSLEEAGEVFEIDEDSGILSLVQHVDRESKPVYEIKVVATDQGSPHKSSETTLRILLLDVNDNPPEFERLAYHADLPEDASISSSVLAIFATSKDTGLNAKISYFIIAGNERGIFDINQETGIIYTTGELDFETAKEYILTVQAKDHGAIPLHSMAIVNISVFDINDNAPVFSQTSYVASVGEEVQIGSDVLKVIATDGDSVSNAMLTYSIIGGNTMSKFRVSPLEGIVSVAAQLDRESISHYSIQVQATDSGVPQLFSIATVNIEVTDYNDNAPTFSEDSYNLFVQEDRKIDTSILQFLVSDEDLDPNGAPFSFDIYDGNEGGEFHVDKDGALRVAKKLNRIARNVYNLTVRVFDNGSPPLHSDVSVTLNVIEESSYPPEVTSLDISISSYLDDFPGGIIGHLKATDADMYDELTFEVVSANRHLFDIDKHDGRIIAFAGLDSGEYLVNVSVSDGKYISFGDISVSVSAISDEMIQNSITIQFANMNPREFLSKYKKDFQRVLKRELNVRGRDVEVINVQSSPDPFSQGRSKRATDKNLDILFAVRKSTSAFYRSNTLRKKVIQSVPALEKGLQVVVLQVYNDICDSEMCEEGRCFSYVEFNKDTLVPIMLNDQSFVSAEHQYLHECRCTDGYIGEKCIPSPSSCEDNPCPAYKVCETHLPNGFQCVCPSGKTGKRCDKEVNFSEMCTDANCQRGDKPMTFSGQSYAKWSLHSTVNFKERLSLFMRIRTHKHNSNLMNAMSRDLRDYSILEIVNGMVQYRFNCGSGEGLVMIPHQVSDGRWHTIMLERRGNEAEILLDAKYSALTMAPGVNEVLNLDKNDIYFGGEVEFYRKDFHNIRRGYEGCMEDIRIFNVRMPISGSNAVALNQELVGVEFHCKEMGWIQANNNICSSFPCMNSGRCESTGLNSYICKCSSDSRYRGSRCEIDRDPCADNPCLYNGMCENVIGIPNEFHCSCLNGLQGKRCEYGRFCTPNPCKNGGTCIEAPRSSMCVCMPGFSGDYCDESADLCQSEPCKYGGICHPMGSSYFCNCTEDRKGRHCEDGLMDVHVPSLSSSHTGIGTTEIFVIAGVVGAIILIVVVFIFVRIRLRKRRDRNNVTRGIAEDENDVMLNGLMDEKRSYKASNYNIIQNIPPSPRPPPVPTRPASYTPSVNTSMNTLNNFDTVRNYGSAADELENCHNIPTYPECLQTFIPPPPRSVASIAPSLPPPPPSNPASETDSIQKNVWEFDYPNILENYIEEKKQPEKMAKLISLTKTPPVSRTVMLGQDTTSISSLPLSESEDDQIGYHWDTSDWAPRPSLPDISELPVTEVLDSPCSSLHSTDSNTHVMSPKSNLKDEAGIFTDPEYIDSEYVGDSEYAENEFDNEDQDASRFYMNVPDYHKLLSLPQFQAENSYNLPDHNLDFRPGEYLPNYSFSEQNSEHENMLDLPPPYEDGEFSQSEKSEDDNNSVVHYGFPPPTQGFLPDLGTTDSEYNGDYARIPSSVMDNMSVSMCGYTSTNASCSDISGLCEIEDSEVNLSDDESAVETDSPDTPGSQLHTQV